MRERQREREKEEERERESLVVEDEINDPMKIL